MNLLALFALFMLAKPGASSTTPAAAASGATQAKGVRVVGKVLMIPLRDGQEAIVATLPGVGPAFDALVIGRGTVYGSRNGEAVVLRCGSEADAKAIAEEIRGKF
jgi:hypothetical protein